MSIHKGPTKAYLDNKYLGEVINHRFDGVTYFCIYCHLSQEEYFNKGTPCKRIMDDADNDRPLSERETPHMG